MTQKPNLLVGVDVVVGIVSAPPTLGDDDDDGALLPFGVDVVVEPVVDDCC